jgi:hypothetical protein
MSARRLERSPGLGRALRCRPSGVVELAAALSDRLLRTQKGFLFSDRDSPFPAQYRTRRQPKIGISGTMDLEIDGGHAQRLFSIELSAVQN